MKRGKKLICIFLALVLIFSVVPVTSFASQERLDTHDNINYESDCIFLNLQEADGIILERFFSKAHCKMNLQ